MWGERAQGKPLTRVRHNPRTMHDVGVLPEGPGKHLRRRRPRSVIDETLASGHLCEFDPTKACASNIDDIRWCV
jgi:hypothetical protein